MADEILTATTSATQSDVFAVKKGEHVAVHTSPQLGSGETASVQKSIDGGTTWFDMDTAQDMTSTKGSTVITTPGENYRVDKDATSSSVGIYKEHFRP